MSSSIVAMMLLVSTLLGALGLIALLWGLKSGQFDDIKKFIDGARYDNEDGLKDAIELEKRAKKLKERKKVKDYKPPD